jgi:hypothetical protein
MAKEGAEIFVKTYIKLAVAIIPVIWTITWAINKYMFTREMDKQATSYQIETLSNQVNSIASGMKKLGMLDSIATNQKCLRSDVNKINTCVRLIARNQVKSTDVLINIIEQLPPLITAEKKNDPYQLIQQNLNANLVSLP